MLILKKKLFVFAALGGWRFIACMALSSELPRSEKNLKQKQRDREKKQKKRRGKCAQVQDFSSHQRKGLVASYTANKQQAIHGSQATSSQLAAN